MDRYRALDLIGALFVTAYVFTFSIMCLGALILSSWAGWAYTSYLWRTGEITDAISATFTGVLYVAVLALVTFKIMNQARRDLPEIWRF